MAVGHVVEHHGGEEPGFTGIPVRDEIQLEKQLSSRCRHALPLFRRNSLGQRRAHPGVRPGVN